MEIVMFLMENLIFPLLVSIIVIFIERYIDNNSEKVIFLIQMLLLIASYIKNYIRFFNNFSSHLWCLINFEDHSNFARKNLNYH